MPTMTAPNNSGSLSNPNAQVAQIFKNRGVPSWVWIPILGAESGGHPNIISKGANHSVGLFQLNPVSGQGKGYSTSYLQNPINNAQIASVPIAQAYHDALLHYANQRRPEMPMGATQTQILTYVVQHSGHAGLAPPYSNDVINVYNNMRKGVKYNGWGLNKSGGAVISQAISGTYHSVSKSVSNAVSSLNPVKSAESYISSHWITWVLVIALVMVIALMIYKGVVS